MVIITGRNINPINRDITVTKVMGYGMDAQGSIPDKSVKIFFLATSMSKAAQVVIIQWARWWEVFASLSWVCEADHSSPPNA
jgi:hypothetical protein